MKSRKNLADSPFSFAEKYKNAFFEAFLYFCILSLRKIYKNFFD